MDPSVNFSCYGWTNEFYVEKTIGSKNVVPKIMITLYSLWITLYPFIMEHPVSFTFSVGPMRYYLKCYQNCGSNFNDHPVPFDYGSPCTLSLWTTLYSLTYYVIPHPAAGEIMTW